MTAAITSIPFTHTGFEDQFEQYAEEAAFLWLLRSIAVHQPHYLPEDVAQLEERIDHQLTALQMHPEAGWRACEKGLELAEPGEVFTAAVVAFRSLDIQNIQKAVDVGLSTPDTFKALVSALAWLPGRFCHPWVKKFFTSKETSHKRLALAVCNARREDPCGYLNRIMGREDCRADRALHAQCLKSAGIFKRKDLVRRVEFAAHDSDPEVMFQALRANVYLGDRSAPHDLKRFALEPGPYQLRSLRLAVRILPPTEARRWISVVLKKHNQYRYAIQATAALGDAEAIPWLITCMRDPKITRIAGEAFHQITGIDLEAHELHHRLPDIGREEPEQETIGLDEDENLPWPNSEKIAALWETLRHRFPVGKRLFLGREIETLHLSQVAEHGCQRLRAAAAIEWGLKEPMLPLVNPKQKK